MRGFRCSRATDQARQLRIQARYARSRALRAYLDSEPHSAPGFHVRARRHLWVKRTLGMASASSRSRARLMAILSASGSWRMYSAGIRDTLSTWTALGHETAWNSRQIPSVVSGVALLGIAI